MSSRGIKSGDDDRYVNVPEAAEFLSLTEKAVRNLVFKRQVPFIRKGRRIRFRKSDLICWMEADRHEAIDVNSCYNSRDSKSHVGQG